MPSALRSTLSVMLCLVNHSISVEIDTTTSGGTSSTQIFPSKKFRLYTFNREKPFINIKDTIFQWRSYTSGTSQRFRAKVRICTYNCNQGIISDEYCTEFNIYSFILHKFLVLNDFIFKLKMFIGSGILLKNYVSWKLG